MTKHFFQLSLLLATTLAPVLHAQADDNGIAIDQSRYANRMLLPDFTAADCPDMPRGLEQVKGNLYRHISGPGLAVHSGLVLITKEGALVIDPAATCTAGWLRDEIRKRFNLSVKCVVYTHAHTDHISGGQVFQQDGAIVVANQREPSPRRVVTFRVSGPLAALVSAGLLRNSRLPPGKPQRRARVHRVVAIPDDGEGHFGFGNMVVMKLSCNGRTSICRGCF